MKPDVSNRAWVLDLPDHAIFEIEDVMHDLLGGVLRRALSDERWRRHSVALTQWPTFEHEIAPALVVIEGPQKERIDKPRRAISFVHFCGCMKNFDEFERRTPDDPKHRPVRMLDRQVECSCGWREGLGRVAHVKRWRDGRFWWPLVTMWKGELLEGRLGNGQPVPYYAFCRYADTVDDPRHAPLGLALIDGYGSVFSRCICGSDARHDPDKIKVLSAV